MSASDLVGAEPVRAASARRRWRPSGSQIWVWALVAILAILVIYPLATLVIGALSKAGPLSPDFSWTSLSLSHFVDVLSRSSARTALLNSVITSGGGTLVALALGLFFAWLTERTDTPGKRLIATMGLFPLFVPPLVAAIAWSLLGAPRTGLLNVAFAATGLPFRLDMYSYGGIIFVFGIYYAPYAYLFAAAALRNMDGSLEEAAAIAGVGPFRTLLTITLPVIAPAVVSAALMCFVVTLGIWGIPAVLGTPARITTSTTFIYTLFQSNPPDYGGATAASWVLVAMTGMAVLLQRRLMASRNAVTITGKSMRPRRVELGRWGWLTAGLGVFYLAVAVVLPMLTLIFIATRRYIFVANFNALFDFSLFGWNNFISLFGNPHTLLSIWNSLIVGTATAALGTVLCFAIGYTILRTRVRGRAFLDLASTLPVAFPGLVIGIGYLWAYITLPIGIYGTLSILVLAGLARYLPDGLRSISGALGQAHRELEEASWICGAGVLRTIVSIVLPVSRSGVGAAALLIFVLSVREYGATLFLYNSHTVLMPLLLIEFIEAANVGVVAAFSLVQVAVLIGMIALGWALMKSTGRLAPQAG